MTYKGIFEKLYNFLCSTRLALILLILIAVACFVGVVILPEPLNRQIVFSSLWFNGLLIFLVINVIFCFFGRIWKKKVTLISLGLIIFHFSFVLMFIGMVYDSFFYFRGAIRLTEGETLSIGEPESYDMAEWGRFFDHSALKGELYFYRLHPKLIVNGKNKGVSNEIEVAEKATKNSMSFVYITNPLNYRGLRFYQNKDGFAPLFVIYDKDLNEIYGAYIPLQSLKQKDKTYLYTTGTSLGPGTMSFPPEEPVLKLQAIYHRSPLKNREGSVTFKATLIDQLHGDMVKGDFFEAEAPLGEKARFGDYYMSMQEVRYWASMDVRYNPGVPLILGSLWFGLGGVLLTSIARLIKKTY